MALLAGMRGAARGFALRTVAVLPTSPTLVLARGMAIVNVEVPSMGDSISDGTVAAVLASPGAAVEESAPLADIETDKVRTHAGARGGLEGGLFGGPGEGPCRHCRGPCARTVRRLLVPPRLLRR